MASIREEISVRAKAADVWDAVRDVGKVHERLAPGFVVNTLLEEGARVVTFGNGLVARELVVDVDDAARRMAWAVVGSPRLTHHNASLEVRDDDAGGDAHRVGRRRPARRGRARPPRDDPAGMAAMKRTLEGAM